MHKRVSDFTVVAVRELNPSNFRIDLRSDLPLPQIWPGQFTNIEIPGNKEVFLRRPFSFFDVDYPSQTVSVLVKVLGKGSLSLSRIKEGEKLSLIYPLGKGFSKPPAGKQSLAIGGGSGVAPMLFLAKQSGVSPADMQIILGAKTEIDLIPTGQYNDFATIHHTTEDGSSGVKGKVTDHPLFSDFSRFDTIYACGPLPMMKAIAKSAYEANINCEVSLENLMACGFGVCLCCIEPTIEGNKCVCTHGPVFNVKELKW